GRTEGEHRPRGDRRGRRPGGRFEELGPRLLLDPRRGLPPWADGRAARGQEDDGDDPGAPGPLPPWLPDPPPSGGDLVLEGLRQSVARTADTSGSRRDPRRGARAPHQEVRAGHASEPRSPREDDRPPAQREAQAAPQ